MVDAMGGLVAVTDQGPGLSEADLPFVFDRFYRGSGSRAVEVEGFGLGLALSQAIMQAYGGKIEASNLAGGGAMFRLILPRPAEA